MPKKSDKKGIYVWDICENELNYMWNFQLH